MSVTGIEVKVSQEFDVKSKLQKDFLKNQQKPKNFFFSLLKFVVDCHPSVQVSLTTDGLKLKNCFQVLAYSCFDKGCPKKCKSVRDNAEILNKF